MPTKQTQWTRAYVERAYDRISLTVPKGLKTAIEEHADKSGESVNGLINRLLREDMGVSAENWRATAADAPERAKTPTGARLGSGKSNDRGNTQNARTEAIQRELEDYERRTQSAAPPVSGGEYAATCGILRDYYSDFNEESFRAWLDDGHTLSEARDRAAALGREASDEAKSILGDDVQNPRFADIIGKAE